MFINIIIIALYVYGFFNKEFHIFIKGDYHTSFFLLFLFFGVDLSHLCDLCIKEKRKLSFYPTS
jgi:hypothetical protein